MASSGWIYWEVIAFIVGSRLGPVPLSIHAIPTQVLSVLYMIPKGIGIALSVRLSATLASSPDRARKLATGTVAGCIVLITFMTTLMYVFRHQIFDFFVKGSDEPDVLLGAELIWTNVCVYFFVTAVFGVNMGIAIGMGIQWYQGMALVSTLWMFGLPLTYYFAIAKHGGVNAVWFCLWPPYLTIDIIMAIVFARKDWSSVTESIQARQWNFRDASVADAATIEATSPAESEQSDIGGSFGEPLLVHLLPKTSEEQQC